MSKYVNKPSYCKKKNDLSVLHVWAASEALDTGYAWTVSLATWQMQLPRFPPSQVVIPPAFNSPVQLFKPFAVGEYRSFYRTDIRKPYHLQSDNNYYLHSLHSNMSNHFKPLNRKIHILFWCSDSAFAHIWFILIVNCKRIWTERSSQKTLRTHLLCLWLKYNPLHCFCLHFSERNTFLIYRTLW